MMHQGRNPFKGTDYQTLAALSFFLQHLRDSNFSYIHLEAPPSVDFKLVFTDYKIVCEAKDWARGLNDHNVKNIVRKFSHQGTVGGDDELLIICNKSNVDLVGLVENLRSAGESPQNELELWSKLKIWEQTKDTLEQTVNILFTQQIPFWLPEEDIKEFADSIRLQKFHRGSAASLLFTREDFEDEITSLTLRVRQGGSLFNDRFRSQEQQIEQIISDVTEGRPTSGDIDLATLSQKPSLMFLMFNKLKEHGTINLSTWDSIWQTWKVFLYPINLFDVFSRNLQTKENRRYVLLFLEKNLDQLNGFYRDTYFESDLAKLLAMIVEEDKSLNEAILNIIREQFQHYESELFYIKTTEDELDGKSELCRTLSTLYKNSPEPLREQVYDFIIQTFNLVEDGGDYSRYTPKDTFRILKEYLNHDNNKLFKQRFLALSRALASQYEKFFRFGKNYAFKGWDEIGVADAFWGYNYQVSDKHFILETLRPALQDFNNDERWSFIEEYCITESQKVSKDRPDFLNRAAIPFVLNEYKGGNPEALKILKEFLVSRGIPNKGELIYQDLINGDFPNDQKWDLVAVAIERSDTNPFIEKIVGELAQKGHEKAITQLKRWSRDPAYYAKPPFFGSYLIPIIKEQLDSAPNVAVSLFENLLVTSRYLDQGSDPFHVQEIYELLSEVIARDAEDGWRIWRHLCQKSGLTTNQQVLLTGSLFALSKTENQVVIKRAFVVVDTLTSDYQKFINKFSYPYSRELVVQFIENCAAKPDSDLIACFDIAKRFASDPDPSTENTANVTRGEINYHKQILEGENPEVITSVRGRIPWAIQQIVRLGIDERIYDVIKLTRDLTKDENLYVRQQSCVALFRLVATRYIIEDGRRIIPEERVAEIESAAFEMLDDPTNERPALQIAMAHVFNKLRLIDFDRAKKAANYFINANIEALEEYLTTIIYFAEVAERFNQEQRLTFSAVVLHLIDKDSATKSAIAWRMKSLSDHKSDSGESYLKNTIKYVCKIVEKYDQGAYRSIYALIKNNFNDTDCQNELLSLYETCIQTELSYLKAHPDYPSKRWAPYYRNGEMLELMFALSQDEFLKIFATLSQYPLECFVGDLTKAVDLLFQIPRSSQTAVKAIFENLVKRDLSLYEKKKQWEESTRH